MKIRNGFISNSSSSSFIIGIAIVPEDKVSQYKGKNIFQYSSKEGVSYPLIEYLKPDRKIVIESFTGGDVRVNVKDGDWILWLDGQGVSGDYHFWNGCDYDYDVELSEFHKADIETYLEIKKLGGEALYGAGRDG